MGPSIGQLQRFMYVGSIANDTVISAAVVMGVAHLGQPDSMQNSQGCSVSGAYLSRHLRIQLPAPSCAWLLCHSTALPHCSLVELCFGMSIFCVHAKHTCPCHST